MLEAANAFNKSLRNTVYKPILITTCGAVAMFNMNSVMAQVSSNALPTEESQLTEIVVTAQKREERLLDVPMSITAVLGPQLVNAGIDSTLALQQAVPGLLMMQLGNATQPSIRGVGSTGASAGDEPNVALYIDDVYVGDSAAGAADLADVDHIEVLKGPQGTLYGRNSTGGALRIATRSPSFTPQADGGVDYGINFEDVMLRAFATGPLLGDQLAGSVSAYSHTGNGYVEGIAQNNGNTYDKPDNYQFRGKLLYKPSDALKVMVAADAAQNQNENVFIAVPPPGVNPYPGPGSVATYAYHYAGGTQPDALVKSHGFSVDATWDALQQLTVRSISAYRDFVGVFAADTDRVNTAVSSLSLGQNQHNWSQEIDLSSPANQTLTWLGGFFYYNASAWNPYFEAWGGTDYPPQSATAKPVSSLNTYLTTHAYAGFVDGTWNITPDWHLTAGGRYSSETKNYRYTTLLPVSSTEDAQDTWSKPTYRAVLRYDVSQQMNVYASYSTGFKSGGYNALSSVQIPVQPETLKAYEVGIKWQIDRILLTAAAYDYDYKDLQVQAHTFIGNAPVTILTNAADATMRGGELQAQGQVTDHFSVNLGVSWEPTADYDNYTTAQVILPLNTPPILGMTVVPYDASGSRVIRTPKWTGNAQLNYKTGLWGGEAGGTLSDSYITSFYWQPGNLTTQAAYNLMNARVSWTDPRGLFTYSVWGTNLTNAMYSTYTTANLRGASATYNQPRQIGIGISAKM